MPLPLQLLSTLLSSNRLCQRRMNDDVDVTTLRRDFVDVEVILRRRTSVSDI